MKFARKFAVVAVLVAALVSSIAAARITGRFVTTDQPTVLTVDGENVTFPDAGDLTKFLDTLRNVASATPVAFSVTLNNRFTEGNSDLLLATGGSIRIAIVNGLNLNEQTWSVNWLAPPARSKGLAPSKILLFTDLGGTVNTLTVTTPVNGGFSLLGVDNAQDIRTIVDNNAGFFTTTYTQQNAIKKVQPNGLDANGRVTNNGDAFVATGDAFDGCYQVGDMLIWVHKAADDNVTVTVSLPYQTSFDKLVEKADPAFAPIVVFVLGFLVLPFVASQIHGRLDPVGYELGKRESSIPDFYKDYILYDTEFEGDEDLGYDGLPSDVDEMVRVDPQTGRSVRIHKDGTPVDDESAFPGETTDALGVSLCAAVLMVPFLL